jgi:hypothetical protein
MGITIIWSVMKNAYKTRGDIGRKALLLNKAGLFESHL